MSTQLSKSQYGRAERKIKPVQVRITTTRDPSKPYDVKWKGGWFWKSGPIGTHYGHNMDLNFELRDQAGTGVTFKSRVQDAFGAAIGSGKCPAAGSDAGGEIDWASSSVSGTTMLIRDLNMSAGELSYAVYFDKGPPLDPIIKNTGGGTGA